MYDEFVWKVFQPIILAVVIVSAYVLSIKGGKYLVYFIGLRQRDLIQFVVTIILSSCIAFIGTLFVHYFSQIIPFIGEKKFITYYFGVHLIFLYSSGLVAAISSIEPLLIQMGYISSPIENATVLLFYLMFFMVLANYNIYNIIVINNKLYIFNINEEKYLKIKDILIIIVIIFAIFLMGRMLVLGFNDKVTFILGVTLMAPFMIKKIFFSSYTL